MPIKKKPPVEKFETKVNRTLGFQKENYGSIARLHGKTVKAGGRRLFNYNAKRVKYGTLRYFPTKKADLAYANDNFSVEILLTEESLTLFGSNVLNPPLGVKKLVGVFTGGGMSNVTKVVVGGEDNKLDGSELHVTCGLYQTINRIDKEEGKDKKARVNERVGPFLQKEYGVKHDGEATSRDYSLLLKELVASEQLDQEDIIDLSNQLTSGDNKRVVIEKQVNKQTEWLISTIEELLDDDSLTAPKSKEFGKTKFGYLKSRITGPEHLVEMILTDYGQFCLFGVPALLNTDKYVVTEDAQSNSQFDLILITHLGEVEVVELKRTDEVVLDYDQSRGKFYPSKSLSVAIAQAERYISLAWQDNDENYKIKGKKIREYINAEVGGTLYVETVRPSALILIGSWKTLAKNYDKLLKSMREKISKADYVKESERSYREIKASFKNINVLTYSELLENARTRLELSKT